MRDSCGAEPTRRAACTPSQRRVRGYGIFLELHKLPYMADLARDIPRHVAWSSQQCVRLRVPRESVVMPNWTMVRRAVTPMLLVRLYYLVKHGAIVSGKAEVDLAASTAWGPGCVISAFSKIKIAAPFVMGRGVQIGSGCFIGAMGRGLTIGDHVLISPNCTILTSNYMFDLLETPLQEQGTTSTGVRIGHRVWLGSNSVVLDGAEIGDNVIVSAGSIVSGRIPPNSIVQGSPAKVIFTRRQ